MLKRLMLNLSVAVFVAGLALPVHSAEVRKLNRMRSMWVTWM